MGPHPRCKTMTAPRYKSPNNKEIIATLAMAPTTPGGPRTEGICRMITADAQPAIRDARTYFQTTVITETIPSFMGLPAYQNAGIVRIQKDAVQEVAIPTAPHRSPKIN